MPPQLSSSLPSITISVLTFPACLVPFCTTPSLLTFSLYLGVASSLSASLKIKLRRQNMAGTGMAHGTLTSMAGMTFTWAGTSMAAVHDKKTRQKTKHGMTVAGRKEGRGRRRQPALLHAAALCCLPLEHGQQKTGGRQETACFPPLLPSSTPASIWKREGGGWL